MSSNGSGSVATFSDVSSSSSEGISSIYFHGLISENMFNSNKSKLDFKVVLVADFVVFIDVVVVVDVVVDDFVVVDDDF